MSDLSLAPRGFVSAEHRKVIEGSQGRIHFHDVGSGPPLILQQAFGPLPGMTAWLTWSEVVADLSRDHRCIVMDFPNFGLSGPFETEGPYHEVCAANTFQVMDALGIDSAPVVGASMGGTVTIDMILAAPDRVEKAVIGSCHASTGGDPYVLAPFPSEVLQRMSELQSEPTEAAMRRLLLSMVYDDALITDELVAAIHQFRESSVAHAEAMSRSNRDPSSNLAALAQIHAPMLIIQGRFDRMVPVEQALMLMSHLPQAELVVMNRCGHWPPFEHPRAYTAHVRRFLDG